MILLAALLFHLSSFGSAFAQDSGSPAITPPAAQHSGPAALLWLPREENLDWDSIVKLAAELPQVGLTIAVSPRAFADIPPETMSALPANVEFAMRPVGDPVLPLIKDLQDPAVGAAASDLPSFSRPQDAIAHLSTLRRRYGGERPPVDGVVPAGGAVSRELVSAFYPLGFTWVAVGAPTTLVSSGPWADAHGVVFLPFTPLKRDLSNWSGPGAYVLDDTVELSLSSDTLHALRELSAAAGATPLEGVSTYLKDPEIASRLRASAGQLEAAHLSFSPWTGDYDPWVGQPLKRAAWKLLASVAHTLDTLQGTGTIPAKTIDAAGRQLLDAEGGRFVLNLDSRFAAAVREADDREFRVALSGVFRILSQPVPEDLQRPLVPAGGEATTDETADAVQSGEDWIAFRNPPGKSVAPWPLPAKLSAEQAPSLFDLQRFAVAWDTATVSFSITVATVADPLATRAGFSWLMTDIYVDMNHRIGAGSTALLPGREAMAEARDAWEYAISVSGFGGRLYRAGPEGQMALLDEVPVRLSTATATVAVDVPASILRGNPKKWGYIVAALAVDPKSKDQEIWTPLKDREGNPLLDVLAPWQREPLTASQRRRLEAVRLK